MRDIIGEIDQCYEIKHVIEYARNNCREGSRAEYINNLKYQFKGPMVGRKRWKQAGNKQESRWVEHSYNIFESFLSSRGISDPYKDCTLTKPKA
jgi:hypothetical protein